MAHKVREHIRYIDLDKQGKIIHIGWDKVFLDEGAFLQPISPNTCNERGQAYQPQIDRLVPRSGYANNSLDPAVSFATRGTQFQA